MFACRICYARGTATKSGPAGDIDDSATLGRQHEWEYGLGQIHAGCEIDVEHAVPLALTHGIGARKPIHDACHVSQYVHVMTILLYTKLDSPGRCLRRADIAHVKGEGWMVKSRGTDV